MHNFQILHFNDVYHLSPQKREPVGGAARFATIVKEFRAKYGPDSSCVLFSGDLFNPSVESSITVNDLGIDVACFGNHDFDFGLPTLKALSGKTNFPWLLSNVLDSESGNPVAGGKRFHILEKNGLKLGIIGLVENLPPTLQYKDFIAVGKELAAKLRDPNGDYAVDLVIALTHSRLPNDILLARETQDEVDLILGGHDHFYYVGKGCEVINGWTREEVAGSEEDNGVRVVKSGTDFRELSIIECGVDEIDNEEGGTIKIIKNLSVTRQEITSTVAEDPHFAELITATTSNITEKMSKSVAYTLTPWDCRSTMLRTQETAFGNFVADLMLYAYQSCYHIDCSMLCGGSVRSDAIYPPGEITLGDLLEIFPFEDTVVVIKITGQQLWDALENSVSMVPKQEGRFPIVSGLKIEYNQKADPGSRLRNVWLTERCQPTPMEESEKQNIDNDSEENVPYTIVEKLDLQKTYTVCTRGYMASGYDGFTALAKPTTQFLVDDENGILLSTLVRRYFLGLYYINAMKFNKSCEDRAKEAVLKAVATWKKLAETKREINAHKNVLSRNIQEALNFSLGETIEVNDDDSSDSSRNNDHTDFVKDWVTVAPMIEDRIVTVDF
ncbi:5151_t:CDS:2 [Funneliformis caledonium]|uniref:5151_t:CDS:1 n=1 Tax=Funneliformis caledonium TaxID=1117310 RepID=A0A9N9DR52_9GLOM|nr:5151_t:CDS:2 [Funneliformis caledonium]